MLQALLFWHSRKAASEMSKFAKAVVFSGDAGLNLGHDTEVSWFSSATQDKFRESARIWATATFNFQFCPTASSHKRVTLVPVSVVTVQLLSSSGKFNLVE
jgi:hypothetical protein